MAVIAKPPCDEAAILTGIAEGTGASRGRWVLAATILGSSLAFIDSTVVNVALPALQSALGATLSDVQWVVEAYALTLAALLLTGGALGDAKRPPHASFVAGVVVFAAASALVRPLAPIAELDRGPSLPGRRRRAARAGKPRPHQRVVPSGRARARDRHLVGLHARSRRRSVPCWAAG